MVDESPEPKWSELRYKYDADARNKYLLKRFLSSIPPNEELDIIDLGAGYGHNFLFLHKLIEQDQDWVLIEHDRNVVLKGIRLIASHLIRDEWSVIIRNLSLIATKEDKQIKLHYELDDLNEHLKRFKKVDIVTCNALLDLLKPSELTAIIEALNGTLFYSTLNMERIVIEEESAEKWLSYLEKYLRRDNSIGMEICSWANGVEGLEIGESTWKLDTEDEEFLFLFFRWVSLSLSEFIPKEEITQYFIWERNIKRSIVEGTIEVTVHHCDFLLNAQR